MSQTLKQTFPKTPRTKAAHMAPSTGHAKSPVTTVIGMKKRLAKTPRPLPRKGRKSTVKKARTSAGRVSLIGVKDLFQTPPLISPKSSRGTPASTGTPDSVLYFDIPDTPNGSGEMLVSPLSAQKSARKSTGLLGVKKLFKNRKSKTPDSPSGIKRLMKTPKRKATPASPTGVANIFVQESSVPPSTVKRKPSPKMIKLSRSTRKGALKQLKTPASKVAAKSSSAVAAVRSIRKRGRTSPVKVASPQSATPKKPATRKPVSPAAESVKASPAKVATPVKRGRSTRAVPKVATPKPETPEPAVEAPISSKAIATVKKGKGIKRNASPAKASTPATRGCTTRAAPKPATPAQVEEVKVAAPSPKKHAKGTRRVKAGKASPVKVATPGKRGRSISAAPKIATPKPETPAPVVEAPASPKATPLKKNGNTARRKASQVKAVTPVKRGRTTRAAPKPTTLAQVEEVKVATPSPQKPARGTQRAKAAHQANTVHYKMAEARSGYDFRAVLDATWDDLLDMDFVQVLEELRNSGVFRRRIFRDLQEKYNTTNEKIEALLRLVKDGGYIKYDQLKKCLVDSGQKSLVDIMEAAERGKEYKPVMRKKPITQEEKIQEVLREDLIEYYREKESTMSVAPLVEQHEAEITKFYIRPSMMAYNKPNAFGQKKQSDERSEEKRSEEKTNIRSYRELLLNGNDLYKGIYVTADAGMGKTTFAKMLAVMWCEAHASKGRLIKKRLEKHDINWSHDIETLEKVDFLFLIKLRDFENTPICSLDEMILEMMKSNLQQKSQYTEELLEKVLCNKRCLIIVDGLDEWIHPEKCRRKEVIPHRRAWSKCTVLTTTRPWKLSTVRLSIADIDRQVEISPLDETTARELESRAVEILNKKQRRNGQVAANTKTKTATDFIRSVPNKILGHIRYIPFMLLQMICLWFGNIPIGKSLCEVYSNIIELTLTRWLVKTDSGHTDCECEHSKEHENIKLKCMENNRHCQLYMPLLVKTGELAFSTLFNVIREESLLFDKEHVLKYLSREELKQCLDMGLLSQVKNTTSLTRLRLQLYFPHKTLHEFFCALFIATNWRNAKTGTMSIKQTIANKCTSVSAILEMSEVFVFVCGLNPEVYSDISRHLATIVDTDQSVLDYRNGGVSSDLLEDCQRMRISCFLESTRNQHPECKIVIEDMFVCRSVLYDDMKEDEEQALEKILPDSACSMKSLELLGLPSAGEIVRILEHAEFPCLERLKVRECELTLFQSVLTSAARTLKYLELEHVFLTDDMCSAISTLNNLHGLYVAYVYLSSDSLNAVSDCISGCMSLQKLILHFPYKPYDTDEKPKQHEASRNYLLRSIETKTMLTYLRLNINFGHQNCILDLSKHDKLQKLELNSPLTELHINPEQLVKCTVYRMRGFSAPAVSSLLAELQGAPVLKTLTLGYFRKPPPRIDITALPLLTKFTLWDCDLRGGTVTLTLPLLTEFTLAGCDLRDSTVTLTLPLLTDFTLYQCNLRDSTVTLTLPALTEFTVQYCNLIESTVTLTLPLLTKFTLDQCDLRDGTVTLSPEMTSLETITLEKNTLNIPCCRELFLSISKQPQPITVTLEDIKMTTGEWRELLFDILGKLPKSIHVEMRMCKGPLSLIDKVWRNISDDMKASPAFCVTRTDLRYSVADITFDTVVV